jgi:hypothetical protein
MYVLLQEPGQLLGKTIQKYNTMKFEINVSTEVAARRENYNGTTAGEGTG